MTNDSFIYAVKRNNQRLYMLALSFVKNHYDAEDILQNAFLKLWKYDGDFESTEHITDGLRGFALTKAKIT